MNGDNPNIYEIMWMADFCKKFSYVYIYDTEVETTKALIKYCKMAEISLAGYIKDDIIYDINDVREDTVDSLSKISRRKIGILAYSEIESVSIKKYKHFMISEYNKRTIQYKMKPRSRDRFWLEVNLADHCNLNCQMCDHFAPIAEKTFMSIEVFERDMKRLAMLMENEMGIIKLQGGEPFLNKDIIEYMRISRELFPKSVIWIFTDGILLLNSDKAKGGNVWEALKKYNVEIQLTLYPLKIKYEEIDKKAKEYGVKVTSFYEVGDRKGSINKQSVKHPMDIKGKRDKYEFISCYQFNESIVLNNGKIYTCPFIPYVKHLNKKFDLDFRVTEQDYIDIYTAESYEEIAEFCTHRVPFCNYCSVRGRRAFLWKQSTNKKEEWLMDSKDKMYLFLMKIAVNTKLYDIAWLRKLGRKIM